MRCPACGRFMKESGYYSNDHDDSWTPTWRCSNRHEAQIGSAYSDQAPVDLNETIAELARESVYSVDEVTALAREYPDPGFLRFVVSSWNSGVRLAVWQLAGVFYAHPRQGVR